MRLSIECNGCKATLTSGSNFAPVNNPPKKEKAPKANKEQRETGARDGRISPPLSTSNKKIDHKPVKKTRVSSTNRPFTRSFFSAERCNGSYYVSNKVEEEVEEEEDLVTRSSSKSFSSDSSKYYKIKNKKEKKKAPAVNKVGRGVAVVEQSSDPYGDFRRSMVEMIMARQKLTANDLSNLLRCYLSLNPPQHHPVILEAFSDIYMGSSVHRLLS